MEGMVDTGAGIIISPKSQPPDWPPQQVDIQFQGVGTLSEIKEISRWRSLHLKEADGRSKGQEPAVWTPVYSSCWVLFLPWVPSWGVGVSVKGPSARVLSRLWANLFLWVSWIKVPWMCMFPRPSPVLWMFRERSKCGVECICGCGVSMRAAWIAVVLGAACWCCCVIPGEASRGCWVVWLIFFKWGSKYIGQCIIRKKLQLQILHAWFWWRRPVGWAEEAEEGGFEFEASLVYTFFSVPKHFLSCSRVSFFGTDQSKCIYFVCVAEF